MRRDEIGKSETCHFGTSGDSDEQHLSVIQRKPCVYSLHEQDTRCSLTIHNLYCKLAFKIDIVDHLTAEKFSTACETTMLY